MKQTQKKKVFGVLAVAVLIALILIISFSMTGNVTEKDKEVIKIGVSLPLSGDVAFLGESAKNAILLAQSELGETKFEYVLIFEDNMFDGKQAATNAEKLISVNNVDAIISAFSGPANGITPKSEPAKVIHMSIASDTSVADGLYTFDHVTTPEEEVSLLVAEMQRKGISKVAYFGALNAGATPILNEFKRRAIEANIEIVLEDESQIGNNDFKTALIKAEKKNPDVYLLILGSPGLETFAKQSKELNQNIPMVGIESFDFTAEKDLFEGQWYVGFGVENAEFTEKYIAVYGENPQMFAADNYDNFNILIKGYESFKEKPTTTQVAEKILTFTNINSAFGLISSDENGVFTTKATLRQIVNGEVKILN
ncbi:MAG: ABC transporter substrate-binding protein [Nanoarchaeota archaeon]|jgi:branched-chain amino acid transport system substrate-binding protein|nr:ABC transporter substrate-binding protein [Nanoarchaeota archaeon]